MERITTARPMVTITRENIDSPSMGRMKAHSISKPRTIEDVSTQASSGMKVMPGMVAKV